jgi:hypothetical protein
MIVELVTLPLAGERDADDLLTPCGRWEKRKQHVATVSNVSGVRFGGWLDRRVTT